MTIDWRIIDALVDDPRAPLDDLVKTTGLGPKTVRKHIQRLVGEGTITMAPKIGALADSGELIYTVPVFGEVEIAELRGVMSDFYHPPAKHLLCRGTDLGDVLGKTRALEKLSGATRVAVSLNREQFMATKRQHSLIREQVRRARHRDGDFRPRIWLEIPAAVHFNPDRWSEIRARGVDTRSPLVSPSALLSPSSFSAKH